MKYFAIVFLALVACPPAKSPHVPDASDASTDAPSPSVACLSACDALVVVGCSEGSDVRCAVRLQTINDGRLDPNPANGRLPLTCLDVRAVHSEADVRAIGQRCNGK
jgi:hypothetical protein